MTKNLRQQEGNVRNSKLVAQEGAWRFKGPKEHLNNLDKQGLNQLMKKKINPLVQEPKKGPTNNQESFPL